MNNSSREPLSPKGCCTWLELYATVVFSTTATPQGALRRCLSLPKGDTCKKPHLMFSTFLHSIFFIYACVTVSGERRKQKYLRFLIYHHCNTGSDQGFLYLLHLKRMMWRLRSPDRPLFGLSWNIMLDNFGLSLCIFFFFFLLLFWAVTTLTC